MGVIDFHFTLVTAVAAAACSSLIALKLVSIVINGMYIFSLIDFFYHGKLLLNVAPIHDFSIYATKADLIRIHFQKE